MATDSDAAIWAAAGSRCAICTNMVGRQADNLQGVIVHIATGSVSEASGLYLPADFLASSANCILMCALDAAVAQRDPQLYPPQELRRLKGIQERRAAERSVLTEAINAADRATLKAHTAYFERQYEPFVFLKLTNEALVRDMRVDRIWFDLSDIGGGELEVRNPRRPLPALIGAGDLFETWIPVAALAGVRYPWTRARAKLGDGTVVGSSFNDEVPRAGTVGGGGTPLAELAANVSHLSLRDGAVNKSWDVFISHASEDKDELVRPLATALAEVGVKVWYDEFEMSIGSSLSESIDRGIANSAFGVVVLSPSFLGRKPWTSYELRGLVQGWVYKKQVMLPIWHKVSRDEVAQFSPTLGDTVAFASSSMTIDEMATGIKKVVVAARAGTDDGD